MEFKEIAKKVKKAERVWIWIGDPEAPRIGEWITPHLVIMCIIIKNRH